MLFTSEESENYSLHLNFVSSLNLEILQAAESNKVNANLLFCIFHWFQISHPNCVLLYYMLKIDLNLLQL